MRGGSITARLAADPHATIYGAPQGQTPAQRLRLRQRRADSIVRLFPRLSPTRPPADRPGESRRRRAKVNSLSSAANFYCISGILTVFRIFSPAPDTSRRVFHGISSGPGADCVTDSTNAVVYIHLTRRATQFGASHVQKTTISLSINDFFSPRSSQTRITYENYIIPQHTRTITRTIYVEDRKQI